MITIKHVASLVLYLIDNVTGMELENQGVSFFLDENSRIRPEYKGPGLFVFIDLPNGKIEITINVYGYETVVLEVEIDNTKGLTAFTVFLVPNWNYPHNVNFKVIEGTHPGLKSIEVVRLQKEICNYKELDERKHIFYIYGHRGKDFKDIPYAIIDETSMTYESFRILKHIDDERIKLETLPERTYKTGDKINRICLGKVDEGGRYVLKLADQGRERYIVRYEDDVGEHFTLFDFDKPETFVLIEE